MSRTIYVGTYTRPDYRGKAAGISVYKSDGNTDSLILSQTVAAGDNPSFLAMHPTRPFLYCVNETRQGGVSAFAVAPETGHLTFLNRQPSLGDDPCHLCVDPTGMYVIVANYGSGSIAVLPVDEDGLLGPSVEFVQHQGSGPNTARQAGPHMHMVGFSPDGRYLLAADLGIDQVAVYRLDPHGGKLTPHHGDGDASVARFTAGAGPRHFVFHPNGRFFFLLNELDSTIVTCAYDPETGTLTPVQTVTTLPEGFTEKNTTAELVIAPSGRFLYSSNRGANTVAIYAIDESTGRLAPIAAESTQGSTPRSFAVTGNGDLLYVANQHSDTLVPFHIHPTTGLLTPTGESVITPTPVCVLIAGE